MNEIRNNTEQEKILLRATFKLPKIIIILSTILYMISSVFFIMGIICFVAWGSILGGIISIILGVCSILFVSLIFANDRAEAKNSSCVITNKCIKGIAAAWGQKKAYSFRLDEIYNVQLTKALGITIIFLEFSNGKTNQLSAQVPNSSILRIRYVDNYQDVYNKLTSLIGKIKNSTDVKVDIEMSKVQAETKKAEAIEKIAASIGSNNQQQTAKTNYLAELKELNELRNAGVISDSEFEAKKKQLLGL